jgi:putative lipoprotein (rSAM/lipoprotein system)
MSKGIKQIFKVMGVFLLGILGFPSCSKEEPDPLKLRFDPGAMMTAYGVPIAKYKVSGKVFTSSGKPITGIKVDVSFSPGWLYDFDGKSTTIHTTADGSFSAEFRNYPRDKVTISFTDVDGEKNQGDFQTQSITVATKQVEKGDGAWFKGTYSVSTTVRMDKK